MITFSLENEEKGPEHADPITKEKNFIFLRIPVLREYLERDLTMENLPFKYDFERVIDDWVISSLLLLSIIVLEETKNLF